MPEPPSHLDDARRRAAVALLRLASQEEVQRVADHLAIARPADREVVIDRLTSMPRYEALAVLLQAAHSTMLMLRDILQFLEHHGVSARTTGCALFLADPVQGRPALELDLSPQAAGVICDWKAPTLRRLGDDPFREARDAWNGFVPEWRRLLNKASPQVRRGRMDVVRTAIHMHAGLNQIVYRPDVDETDYDAQAVLRHLLDQVKNVLESLDRAPRDQRSASHVALIDDLEELVRVSEREVFDRRLRGHSHGSWLAPQPNFDRWELQRHVSEQFLEAFDRFCEDVLALGDAVEGDRLFDLLSANIWSSRPQLFEVWLLVSILDWLERRGYEVGLLKVSRAPTGRCQWQLSYAKDSTPCARVRGKPAGGSVFYQLYRPSGDMPDLCFIPGGGGAPQAQPLWAVDAKHSDAGGYALSDYKATAERYRDSFGAKMSAAVEYFPRPGLTPQNPSWFGPGASLITDASPGATGLPVLLGVLDDVHPPRSGVAICVDVSQSFSGVVGDVVEALCTELASASDDVLDSFVCFAGTAGTKTGMRALVSTGGVGVRGAIQEMAAGLPTGETLLEPLIDVLRPLVDSRRVSSVVVVGDGAFSDCAADPTATMQSRLGVPVSIRSGNSSPAL